MATATAYPRSGSPAQLKGITNEITHPPVTILLIYPLTLILGTIYSVISPTARQSRDFKTASPLTPTIATDINSPPSSDHRPNPVNYFARKDNIFNIYFVKIGWIWFTLAFLALLLTRPYYTKASNINLRGKRTVQAFLRYGIVTCAWFVTTQWFFGPSIMDRLFVLTGGKCEHLPFPAAMDGTWGEIKAILTGAACKAAGGLWRGGHDASGHVFMLVLGSAFLALEALGTSAVNHPSTNGTENGNNHNNGNRDDDLENEHEHTVNGRDSNDDDIIVTYASRFVWIMVGLSWWMLFMTAIWFHTWLEKLSGLLLSITIVYTTYFLPRILPAWADIIGIPGYEPPVRLE